MPKGLTRMNEAREAQRKEGSGGRGNRFFRLPLPGDIGTVRVLDEPEDMEWAFVHVISSAPFKQEICLNQEDDGDPCPGCERELKRRTRVWTRVLWREAPKFKRDEDARIVKGANGKGIEDGTEDTVAVWEFGPEVADTIARRHAKMKKGLISQDVVVERIGSGKETKYEILPGDEGVSNLTATDKSLITERDVDLKQFTLAPSYEEWGTDRREREDDREAAVSNPNPFKRVRS